MAEQHVAAVELPEAVPAVQVATQWPSGDPEPATGRQPEPDQTGPAPVPLFTESEAGEFRSRWSHVQGAFVDDPRRAVEGADALVAAVTKRLAEGFATERSGLEKQWGQGASVSTEDLRLALQRYRSFFDRLLKL